MFFEKEKELKIWYEAHARSFPWRKGERFQSPYEVFVREIMSQQTVMKAFLGHYERFLTAFPSLESLAQSSEEQVLLQWKGLGYYRRALQLLQSAQIVRESGWPLDYAGWLTLPGVGPYTAAMMTSLFGSEWVPAIDGNVFRVLSRYLKFEKPDQSSHRLALQKRVQKEWQIGFHSYLNEWLIELGSLLCVPQKPFCDLCPLQSSCSAYESHLTETLPLKPPRKAFVERSLEAHLLFDGEKWFLEKRASGWLNKTLGWPLTKEESSKGLSYVKHTITHHKLKVFWKVELFASDQREMEGVWLLTKEVEAHLQTSLDLKIWKKVQEEFLPLSREKAFVQEGA